MNTHPNMTVSNSKIKTNQKLKQKKTMNEISVNDDFKFLTGFFLMNIFVFHVIINASKYRAYE